MTAKEQAVAIKMIIAGSRVMGFLQGTGQWNAMPMGFTDDFARAMADLTDMASEPIDD